MVQQFVNGVHKVINKPLWILIPILWLVIFFCIPFLTIFKISFSESAISLPPYAPLITWVDHLTFTLKITLSHYYGVISDALYLYACLYSLGIALFATVFCLLLGYPVAYALFQMNQRAKRFFLMLIILPFWTSFIVRVYAWMGLLNPQGFFNSCLMHMGLIQNPLPLVNNTFAVWLGIVYSYLPFMILPIYSAIEKIDRSLLEAASDLGCRPVLAFWKIVVPLSRPGVLSGALLVFIPAVGEFIIPELLGGSQTLMIGRILWNEFFFNHDWPLACALAVFMLALLLGPMIIFQRIQKSNIGSL